jgi:hypothetical protein
MSRAPRDFSKGKIYKISNDYNDVGSTGDTLVNRFSTHKRDSKLEYVYKKSPFYKLVPFAIHKSKDLVLINKILKQKNANIVLFIN